MLGSIPGVGTTHVSSCGQRGISIARKVPTNIGGTNGGISSGEEVGDPCGCPKTPCCRFWMLTFTFSQFRNRQIVLFQDMSYHQLTVCGVPLLGVLE